MVKIIFGSGESVEWNEGNLPDSLSIHFETPPKAAVPDHISADHLESLCAALTYLIIHADERVLDRERFNLYQSTLTHARERAKRLREGKI